VKTPWSILLLWLVFLGSSAACLMRGVADGLWLVALLSGGAIAGYYMGIESQIEWKDDEE
jgi:hypothetical protein